MNILGSDLSPADRVRNLGVMFDSDFTFASHVSSVCRSCFVGLRDFRRIRRHLSEQVAVMVANALVSSRLDYCNSVFRSLTQREWNRLQCIQNSLARIVSNTTRFSHISPVLKSLHWLPVRHRSVFKALTIVYKCIHTGLPKYLVPFICPYVCASNTRHSKPGNSFLQKPIYNSSGHKSKKHFDNSFAFDGPDLWNGLSESIRTAPTISSFRSRLKTYLFEQAFPP